MARTSHLLFPSLSLRLLRFVRLCTVHRTMDFAKLLETHFTTWTLPALAHGSHLIGWAIIIRHDSFGIGLFKVNSSGFGIENRAKPIASACLPYHVTTWKECANHCKIFTEMSFLSVRSLKCLCHHRERSHTHVQCPAFIAAMSAEVPTLNQFEWKK